MRSARALPQHAANDLWTTMVPWPYARAAGAAHPNDGVRCAPRRKNTLDASDELLDVSDEHATRLH